MRDTVEKFSMVNKAKEQQKGAKTPTLPKTSPALKRQ